MPKVICHQHCPKGGGTGPAVLVVLAVIVIAAVGRTVLHAVEAVAEIAVCAIAGCVVLAAVALAARHIRRRRMTRPALPAVTAQAVSAARRRQIAGPAHYHVHLHGLSDEQLAAITRRK